MPDTQIKEFFGLRDSRSGELVRIDSERYDGTFVLSNDTAHPVFEATSFEALQSVLYEDTPSYNSSAEAPGWGCFGKERLQPVKVKTTTTVECEELVVPEPVVFTTVEVRDVPYIVARRYAGGDFDTGGKSPLVFWLCKLPDGMSLEDVKKLEGTTVFHGSRYSKRFIHKAVAVPEDYASMFEGHAGVLLLVSNTY